MKSSIISSKLPIKFHLKTNNLYWLFLCVPLFASFTSSAVAKTLPQIAQVTPQRVTNLPTLKLGSTGEAVTELQGALKLLGYYTGTIDGNYSQDTATAVSQFQQSAGLTPDGVVGETTWEKLFPNMSFSNTNSNFPTPTTVSQSTQTVSTAPEPQPATPKKKVTNITPEPKPATPKKKVTNITPEPKPVTPKKKVTNITPEPKPVTPKNRVIKNTTPQTHTQENSTTNQTPGIQYTSNGLPILRPKMHGPEVVKLQEQLNKLGYLQGGVDGDFGPTTEEAVKALQKKYGLEADGVAGGATWEILMHPRQK